MVFQVGLCWLAPMNGSFKGVSIAIMLRPIRGLLIYQSLRDDDTIVDMGACRIWIISSTTGPSDTLTGSFKASSRTPSEGLKFPLSR